MLTIHDIPNDVREGQDGLWGDVELFLESCTEGEQRAAWDLLEAQNAVSDDAKVKAFINSSNFLAMNTSFLPR